MSTGDPDLTQPDLSGNNNKPTDESMMKSQENSDGSDNDEYDNGDISIRNHTYAA